mgnify:CR=1 FL=1
MRVRLRVRVRVRVRVEGEGEGEGEGDLLEVVLSIVGAAAAHRTVAEGMCRCADGRTGIKLVNRNQDFKLVQIPLSNTKYQYHSCGIKILVHTGMIPVNVEHWVSSLEGVMTDVNCNW